jgi:uncharacterized membrane protein YkvA (DUF1232 family)
MLKQMGIKQRVAGEVRFVRLVMEHPQTPRLAKWLAGALVAYALSPIDLIPDFIPVLGYVDDAIILPLGWWLLNRVIPANVRHECRYRAFDGKGA